MNAHRRSLLRLSLMTLKLTVLLRVYPMKHINGSIMVRIVHDDVIKWKHFPRYWPFVWEIHRSPVDSPHKWPVTQSFDVFFDLPLNKRLSKQSWGWWFETPSRQLWRHCNGFISSVLTGFMWFIGQYSQPLRLSCEFRSAIELNGKMVWTHEWK